MLSPALGTITHTDIGLDTIYGIMYLSAESSPKYLAEDKEVIVTLAGDNIY